MRPTRKSLVALYALGGAVVIAALAALSALVVRQQVEHARAVAEALHQEDIRTALWRMETRVGALLALTTSRASLAPPTPGAYAANSIVGVDNAINPAQAPSPAFASELLAAADRAFDLACSTPSDAQAPTQRWTNPEQQNIANRGLQRSADEFERRAWSNLQSQVASPAGGADQRQELLVGPLASRWERDEGRLGLQFARRIQGPSGASHESYRIEWEELSGLLRAEIVDLFPTAQLEPIEAELPPPADADRALRLAAAPVRLVVPPPRPAEQLPRGYAWTLAGAWAALLFALAAGALALRASHTWGDRHRRFTHAVTHELRTPLTTFRLYSEMLARGMVPAASQGEYLATLERESGRLARLVDNVLRYARLEDGKRGAPLTALCVSELLERCAPELARNCAAHGARLELDERVDGGARVVTDAEAVLQILSNLVENACKYGRAEGEGASAVTLRVAQSDGQLTLEVLDEGPGVPAVLARAIFEPFERGGRDSSDPAHGVGLGLALARALARELGGTLTLEPAERGATFRLTLPLAE